MREEKEGFYSVSMLSVTGNRIVFDFVSDVSDTGDCPEISGGDFEKFLRTAFISVSGEF